MSHIYGDVRNHRKKLELWRREEPKRKNHIDTHTHIYIIYIYIYCVFCVLCHAHTSLILEAHHNALYVHGFRFQAGAWHFHA